MAAAQVAPPPMYLSTGGMSNGSLNITNERDVIVMDQISNDAVLDVEAYNEIILQPPTDLISYTNNGRSRFAIKPNALDPVSYHPNGWNSIGKWDKLEVGISLPPNIDQQIENFLNGVSASNGINPYDYDKIKLKGIFSNGLNSYERFGFYYREIAPTTDGTWYTQSKSNKPFRVRFAPNAIGYWTMHLELSINGTVIETYDGRFGVVDTGKPGPISIGPHNRFQFDDGGAFFAIGQDFGPPIHNNGPNQCGTTIQPNDLTDYVGYIDNLADQGGNFIRIPMDIHSFYIEWEESKVYGSNRTANENFKRQYCAHSLDKVFDKMEARNVYSILISESCFLFQIESGYKCGDVSETEWPKHPYSQLNDYNINQPLDIFSNTSFFNDVYKKRLFYIQARYGYSPNLSAYEVCNEIDGIEKGSSSHYDSNQTTRNIIYDWAINVADYYKTLYPYHMATISTADSHYQNPNRSDNPTSNTSFDIRSPHHYGHDNRVPLTRFSKAYVQLYSTGTAATPQCTRKPVLFGEMGMTDNTHGDKCTNVEFHNGMWASGCSGAAGAGLYRYDYENNNKRNQNLPALHAFFNNMPFATDDFTPAYVSEPQADPKVSALYNVTQSGHKAYGWYFNRTFFWANDPNLQPNCIDNDNGVALGNAMHQYQEVKLDGFQNAKDYTVELWRTYGGGGVQFQWQETSSLFSGKISLKKNLGSCVECEYAPDYGIKIYKEDGNFRMSPANQYSSDDKGHKYLQNDTIGITENGFQVTGKFDPNIPYHHWDYGNGTFSDEQYPIINYSKAGVYEVIYSTLNSIGDTVHYHQNTIVTNNQNGSSNEKKADRLILDLIPNPSSGIFSILNPKSVDLTSVVVLDSKGSQILKYDAQPQILDLEKYPNGLYSVLIYTDQGVYSKKIIKMD